MDAWQNIKDKKYEVTDEDLLSRAFPLSYPTDNQISDEDRREAKREYDNLMYVYRLQFKADLAEEFEITDHPKVDSLFSMAWDRGHGAGYEEVYFEYQELIELIKGE